MCKKELPVATNARARKDSQRRRRNCRGDCRDSRTSYPRRNAHRCARRRGSTAPVIERPHTLLADRPHGLPVCANRTACEKFNQLLKRSQQNLGQIDCTRTAAVRNCRVCFPCASPASSSCWAGLISSCILKYISQNKIPPSFF